MGNNMRRLTLIIIVSCMYCLLTSCKTTDTETQITDINTTVGSLGQVLSSTAIPVEGVGLVGGLNGTGSSECPPTVREYLKQYILSELPEEARLDPDSFIDSLNTAVVLIEGIMPIENTGKRYFDLKISALTGTQTISLENGWLYQSEMKLLGRFNVVSQILADAVGPVYVDQLEEGFSNKRTGYILDGGKILSDDYKIRIQLYNPDYKITNVIRNRLNQRFGEDTARALMAGEIDIVLPAKYKEQRTKFIKMVKSMYFDDIPENMQQRIEKHIKQIVENPENDEDEIALETIGNDSLYRLSALLQSPNEHIRLRAARCMLNLRSNAGLDVIKQIILNTRSTYRIEALNAIADSGWHDDASMIARTILNDIDFNVRLRAYEILRKLDDRSVKRTPVGASFYLEQVPESTKKEIYVSRSGQPRIVIFGSPIYCHSGIFIQSENGDITINSSSGQNYATVMRNFPNRREDITGQVRCSLELSDIITALCDEPPAKNEQQRGGLGVSYSDMIALLKQLSDKEAIDADFHAGDLPKIDLNIKK